MATTLAGLTAKEAFTQLTDAGAASALVLSELHRAWLRGSATIGSVLIHATGTSDGAESATYRLTTT